MYLSVYVGLFFLLLHCATCFDHTVVVPKAFRIDAPEKVVLNLHGYQGATVSAYLQTLPHRRDFFSAVDLHLNAHETSSPIDLEMTVKATDIVTFRQQQTVDVVIEVTKSNGKDFISHTEVLVSKHSGYLFVITDRPIYKPQESVNIQAFPLSQTMRPNYDTTVSLSVKTPNGITAQKRILALPQSNNFVVDVYDISPYPIFGKWTVEAKYSANGYETTTETHFSIQRYVLPSFKVSINPTKNFILGSDKAISGTITAFYSYGKPVQGNYFLSMKLKMAPEIKTGVPFYRHPPKFRLATFRRGKANFEVDVSEIEKVLGNGEDISTLVQNHASIYIEATVNDRATDVMESAISPDLPFIFSPYIIDTKRTSTYFIPDLTFQLQVDVRFVIGGNLAPLVDVEIVVESLGEKYSTHCNERGQVNYPLDFQSTSSQIVIIKTTDDSLKAKAQAEIRLTIKPYQSPSGSYLQMRLTNIEVKNVEDTMQITFSFNDRNFDQIRYKVLARGSIVHTGKTSAPGSNDEITSPGIGITQKMVPSARVVAYYLRRDGEVVSNSIWFDVNDQCKSDLSLKVPSKDVLPGSDIEINVEGPKNGLVSVSGVDRAAYFLYNGSRLTQDKMFNKMESYDQGCVRNGGGNARSVFMEAGLYLKSKKLTQLPVRSLNCGLRQKRRKKRQVIGEERLRQQEIDAQLFKCKLDGEGDNRTETETCDTRKQRCDETKEDHVPGCCDEFWEACIAAEKEKRKNQIRKKVGRSNAGGAGNVEASLARLRRNFHDSLLFTTKKLDSNGKVKIPIQAKDQITTFEIDAVSMENSDDGFCVAKTAEVRVFKDVFLQVTTPYSLKRFEQTNIKITTFNYAKAKTYNLKLEVKIIDGDSVCTRFRPNAWSLLQQFQVKAESSSAAHLTVIPLKNGTFPFDLKLTSVEDANVLDHIRKEILVEESGEIKDTTESYPIDLPPNGRQQIKVHLAFPENIVAGTRQCSIYAYANFLGPSIEVDPVTEKPRSVESIFRKPYGCGEQNMLVSGPNVYTHVYLASVGALKPNTKRFNQSIARVLEGYKRELSHLSDRVDRKAFAAWHSHQPSTWLNAFVDKVFIKASTYITDMPMESICDSLEWLLTQQQPDNHFQERRKPIHREMHGAVGGKFTLTAYVAISLLETQSKCSPALNAKIHAAVQNAVTFLKNNRNHKTFTRPYALALLSYTLALHEPHTDTAKETFNRLLSLSVLANEQLHWKGRLARQKITGTDIHAYWYKINPQAIDVETTAYALLAQIEMTRTQNPVSQIDLNRARKIVLWLVSQRNSGGAFISTQDTVIGLQALATYETWINGLGLPPVPNRFTVRLSALSWDNPDPLTIHDRNVGERQEIEVPVEVIKAGGNIVAVAEGSGEGLLSYRCTYRAVVEENPCHLNITHEIKVLNGDAIGRDRNHRASLKINVIVTLSKEKGDPTEMTILEVGLLSGFAPDEESLSRLSKSNAVDGLIEAYEVSEFKVVFYLNRVTRKPLTLALVLVQNVEVSNPEPAKINVYDYYEPEVQCGFFYSLPGETPDLRTINCDGPAGEDGADICKCVEGGCAKCRSRDEQFQSTECLYGKDGSVCKLCNKKDCKNMFAEVCRRNFAYAITVTSVQPPTKGEVFYTFTGALRAVLKYGDDASARPGSNATFMMRRDCYKKCYERTLVKNNADPESGLVVKVGRELTVVSYQPEEIVDRNGNTQHIYFLDENTIIERTPTDEKCLKQKRNWRKKCKNTNQLHKHCDKWKNFVEACKNFRALKNKLLNYGCD